MRRILSWLLLLSAAAGAADPVVAVGSRTGEVTLVCRWTDPVNGGEIDWALPGDALVAAPADSRVRVEAWIDGRPADIEEASLSPGGEAGGLPALRCALPARRLDLEAPRAPGIGLVRLRLKAGTVQRRAVLAIHVPYESELSRQTWGQLLVAGNNLGYWRDPGVSRVEKVQHHAGAYLPPRRFLRITAETANLRISPSLRLLDLVVPSPETGQRHTDMVPVCYGLLHAIETLRDALDAAGLRSDRLRFLSLFRSAAYNESIESGAYGRHIYGDAMDFLLDGDGDGRFDDLDSDGEAGASDALLLVGLIEGLQADRRLPLGGIGVYTFETGDRGVTMHLDLRGHRATWAYRHDATGKKTEFEWASRRFAAEDAAAKTGPAGAAERGE